MSHLVTLGLVIVFACTNLLRAEASLAATNSQDVLMFRSNPGHTGEMPGPGPDPTQSVVELWRSDVGSSASPAVVDGTVYVGAYYHFHAVDATTGSKRWQFAGDFDASSPAVVDGVVYAGGESLYALDSTTGAKRWSFSFPISLSGDVESSPTVAEGMVYVTRGYLYALDAGSGAERWRFDNGGWILSSPAVVEGVVYVESGDGTVYALDAVTGTVRWQFAIGSYGYSSPAVADGVVYVGGANRNFYALDATSGGVLWSVSWGILSSSPAVANGVVYVVSTDGNLYALEATTGAERWSVSIASIDYSDFSPVVANGVVYVVRGDSDYYSTSSDRDLSAFDAASGVELWRFDASGSIISDPVVVGGVIYFSSSDGYLYAIGNMRPSARMTATAQADSIQQTVVAANATVQAGRELADLLAENAVTGLGLPTQFSNPKIARHRGSEAPFELPGSPVLAKVVFDVSEVESAGATLVFAVYDAKREAQAAFQAAPAAMREVGDWQECNAGDVADAATCLMLVNEYAWGVLYVLRDNVVIVIHTFLSPNASDEVVRNMKDLAVWASDIYDQAVRSR